MEKADWAARRKMLSLGLVVWLVATFANGQTSSQGSAVNLIGEITDQHAFGDYVIRIRGTITTPGAQPTPNRLEILKAGQLVHYQVGSYLSIGCTDATIPAASRLTIGQNVTGGKEPELLVQDEGFNSSGTSDWYVFTLEYEFKLVVSLLNVITGESRCPFRDLDGDGIPEFVVFDGAFAGFHASHAESPLPTVVLKLKDGWYEPAPELMKTPVPGRDALARKAQSLRASAAWQAGEPPPKLGDSLIDLIYGGHLALAESFLNEAWPARLSGKKQYWLDLRDRLSEGRYWNQARSLPDANIDGKPSGDRPRVGTTAAKGSDASGGSAAHAQRILGEQKGKAEAVTQEAARILTSGQPPSRLLLLYRRRLSDLEKLRGGIREDTNLNGSDKDRVDTALQGEQESIGRILAKYQELYGR